MNAFLDLTNNAGHALDIPLNSVILLEELDDDTKREQTCQCGIFYDLGNGAKSALIQNDFESIYSQLEVPAFVRLTSKVDRPIVLRPEAIRGIQEMEDGSVLSFAFNQQVIDLPLKSTRNEIREKIDG